MRTSRTTLGIALVLGLVAGPASGATAQSGGVDLAEPVEVTGSSNMPTGCDVGSSDPSEDPGTRTRFTCSSSRGMAWSMSDPRMEGTILRIGESSKISGDWPMDTQVRAIHIENAEGSWRERPRFVVTFPGSTFDAPLPDMWMSVFDGEGGYEGLVAVFQVRDEDGKGQTYDGYIIGERLLPMTPTTASTTD